MSKWKWIEALDREEVEGKMALAYTEKQRLLTALVEQEELLNQLAYRFNRLRREAGEIR